MTPEQAKELHSSTLWEALCKEIDRRVTALAGKLRHCSKEELESLQMEIKVWESVKSLPQDVVDREE